MSLGGSLGKFSHAPPPQYAGVYEAGEPGKDITLIPFRCMGHESDIVVNGPAVLSDFESFVPCPIDTSKIMLPDSIVNAEGNIRDLLATNIHEVWAKNKIESGFSYAPVSWGGGGGECKTNGKHGRNGRSKAERMGEGVGDWTEWRREGGQ